MVQKAIAESRRGQAIATSAPSTGVPVARVEPQPVAAGGNKKPPPLFSADNNESGFSFDWDDDDGLDDMLEDENDEVKDTAGSAAPPSLASTKVLPSTDISAEALTPQPPKAVEKLDADNDWDDFNDFDDTQDAKDKGTPPVDATVQSDDKEQGGNQNMSTRSPMQSKSDDAPMPRSPPSALSPASSNNDGGDGDGDGGGGGGGGGDEDGWDEGDDLVNFDDMLNEKYGDEDATTHHEAEPTPTAPVPAPMEVEESVPSIAANAEEATESEATEAAEVKLGPPPSPAPILRAIEPLAKPSPPLPAPQPPTSSNETIGTASAASASVSRPKPPTPPPRGSPPVQSKVATAIGQPPIRTVREQSQQLGEEERKRMAEEGRRLLREKRLAQQSKLSSTTALPSGSSAPRTTTQSVTSRATTSIRSTTGTSRPTTTAAGRANPPSIITDPSERERLIMEGRRLLQEARKAKANQAAGATTATPRPKPTPPPRRSPPSSTAPAPPPPPPPCTDTGESEKAGDEDDDWDDFNKFEVLQ